MTEDLFYEGRRVGWVVSNERKIFKYGAFWDPEVLARFEEDAKNESL